MAGQIADPQMNHVDADWERVRSQLADPAWDFRTTESLSTSTGLRVEQIEDLLAKHHDQVRVANVPDREGRLLYTLADRPMKARELLANVRAFITKSL
jgi:hypothetical protein